MKWSFIPNLITVLRVLLLFPLSYLLLQGEYHAAVIIFFIAGFSDALDGFLAKRFFGVSRFGAILDPLADKALLVLTMAILTYNQKLSWTLFATVAARDLYIVGGALYYHWRVGPFEMAPSLLSKFNTFIQLSLVTLLLVSLSYLQLPPVLIQGLVLLTYLTTVTSGIHYTWVWGRKLRAELATAASSALDQSDSRGEPPRRRK